MTYTPPDHNEARAILSGLHITGGQAAEAVGLANSRMIRRYTSAGEAMRSAMPFAVPFTLARRFARVDITPENWREDLAQAKVLRREGAADADAAGGE